MKLSTNTKIESFSMQHEVARKISISPLFSIVFMWKSLQISCMRVHVFSRFSLRLDEGVYNTYVIDTDYREWALVMHCAEKQKSNRYLSALMLSRTPTVGINVINFLRFEYFHSISFLFICRIQLLSNCFVYFQRKIAAIWHWHLIYVPNQSRKLWKKCCKKSNRCWIKIN